MTDRIKVVVSEHPDIVKAIDGYDDYIKSETLAQSLEVRKAVEGEEVDWLDDTKIKLSAVVTS